MSRREEIRIRWRLGPAWRSEPEVLADIGYLLDRLSKVDDLLAEWDQWPNPTGAVIGLREQLRGAIEGDE